MINPASLHVQPKNASGVPQQQGAVDRAPVFQWASRTFGITVPEAQQIYAKMENEAAQKGQNLNAVSNPQLVTMIQTTLSSPKVQAIGQKAGNIDKKGKIVPGSMKKQSEGGLTLPQGKSIVGDPHPYSPKKPNPEIINNPTGAPVSVTPMDGKMHQKYSSGTMGCYDDGTPVQASDQPQPAAVPDQTAGPASTDQPMLEPITVEGQAPQAAPTPAVSPIDQSPQSPDLPATRLANVLGISKDDAMKILPDLQNAYAEYQAKTTGTGRGMTNAGMALGAWLSGGAAGGANAQNIINSQNQEAANTTIGKVKAEQAAQTQGIANATSIANANQTGFENQAKNYATVVNTQIMKDSMDPDSALSGAMRQGLAGPAKDAGIIIPTHASAAQISQIVAGSTPLEKIANDAIEAHAKVLMANAEQTKGNAAQTTAETGASKEAFAQGLVTGHPVNQNGQKTPPNPGAPPNTASTTAPNTPPQRQYVLGAGGNPILAPEEESGAKAFQERAQKANDYAGNAPQITTQLENAFQQTLATNPNQFGPSSVKAKVTGYFTGNTPQMALNSNLQKVGALNLADQAKQIGSSAELRSATIDQKFIGSSPDATKDGKNVVVDKLLAQAELHMRNQMYAQELSSYVKQHPEDPKGTNFQSNVAQRVFLVNLDGKTPQDQRFALVPKQEANFLKLKKGYMTVPQAEQAAF